MVAKAKRTCKHNLRASQRERTWRKAASDTRAGRRSGVANAVAVVVVVDEARQFAIDAAGRKRYAYLIRSGLAALAASVALAVSTAMSAHASSCDAALGEQVFEKCSACHSLVAGQHVMGPSLNGLNGRKAGTVDGFNFSSALRDSAIVWNDVTLNEFLKSPKSFIPGTVMPFGGIRNATERAALVCYLVSR